MAAKNRIEATQPGEDGTPVRTEFLSDGMRRHTMADGQVFEENGPVFRLEYQSAFPGETYKREIAIFGLANNRPHLFEAWCFVYKALRTYAFRDVVSLENIATGQRWTGEEMRRLMGGSDAPTD